MVRIAKFLICAGALTGAMGYYGWAESAAQPVQAQARRDWAQTPVSLLVQPVPDSLPHADQVRRGQYLVVLGDCMSCHLRDGGEPFSGGRGIQTPFGVIYSANITSDRQTGIGAWTNDQFYRAMHDGVDAHGNNLYPAFPYPWYQLATREDDEAILAYLQSTPAVDYVPPRNHLVFPLNMRAVVKVWNLLNLRTQDFVADPGQSADWNRGAYIVNGLGHCGGCHTPKNPSGGDKSDQKFYGARLDDWVAPDLTSNERTGLGRWSVDDIAEFLRNGRNVHAAAGASMGEVVTYSSSLMSEQDRHAAAVYLKSLAATSGTPHRTADAASMRRRAEVYSDACASCHLADGSGQARIFPPLGNSAALQQPDPLGLEHVILAGVRMGISPSRPSPLAMPSFAWKLTDGEIADVITFLRNSWGNEAAAVSAADVGEVRKRLDLRTSHPTANSGDRN
jgi:mono/diheme cytochrome c family protein